MTAKKANFIASPEFPPPKYQPPEVSETNQGVLALFLLAGPLPFLYSINSVLSLWKLDSFHYILFQAVFFAMYPSLTRKRYVDPKLTAHDDSASQLIHTSQPILKSPQLSVSQDLCCSSTFSEITLHPNSPIEPEKLLLHRYSEECEPLFDTLQNIFSVNVKEDPNNWEVILETIDPIPISILRDKNSEHRYRLECTFSNSPAAVFDSLSLNEDSASSLATSKVLKMQENLEVLDSNSSILYFMTISVWPTSARDVCLLQSSRVLSDGSIISALKSVPHESKPENPSVAVRMETHLAGRWFRPVAGNPKLCKMMGYFHGDPKGWIPKSLVNLAATKFVPKLIYKINENAAQLPFKELTQTISSRFLDVGSSLTDSGSTICDEDGSDPFSVSDLKLVKLEPVIHEEQNKALTNERTAIAPTLDRHLSFLERLQYNLSLPWSTSRFVATAGPILLTAAVVAVIVNRNQS